MLVTDAGRAGALAPPPSVSRWLAPPSCRIILPQYQKQASRFSRRGRREGKEGGREGRERMRKRKKSPAKEGRKLHFSLKGMREHFRQRHAEKRGKPISLFAALPPSFIRAREKSFQQSPAFLPSFLPPSATAAPSALVHSHHCRRWNTRK